MRHFACIGVAAAALAACAPIYIPAKVHAPLFQKAGDFHVAGSAGTQGVEVDGAYAITDVLAARASVQANNNNSEGNQSIYRGFAVGAGYFWAPKPEQLEPDQFPSGPRAGVSLDAGAAASRASFTLTINGVPSTTTYSGLLLRGGLQGYGAWEWKYFALGAAVRLSYLYFFHDPQSERPGERAAFLIPEPLVFLRAGYRPIYFEAQAGVLVPVWQMGAMGVPPPIIISLGVVLEM